MLAVAFQRCTRITMTLAQGHSGPRWRHSTIGAPVRQTSLFDDAGYQEDNSNRHWPTSCPPLRQRSSSCTKPKDLCICQALNCRAHHCVTQPPSKACEGRTSIAEAQHRRNESRRDARTCIPFQNLIHSLLRIPFMPTESKSRIRPGSGRKIRRSAGIQLPPDGTGD
jgi:hypothetical protein